MVLLSRMPLCWWYLIYLMHERDYELYEAIAISGRSRLRPVIMTSATTITENELFDTVPDKIKRIDAVNEEVVIRAFKWNILKMV